MDLQPVLPQNRLLVLHFLSLYMLPLHFSADTVDTVLLPTASPAALRLPLNNCHRKLQNDSWRQCGVWREQVFLMLRGSSSRCNNDKANSHLQLFLLEQQGKQSIYNEEPSKGNRDPTLLAIN